MAVYVDNLRARYGRLIMCHMLADTDAELHAMADRIGVARRWWQSPQTTSGSHYDICLSKRALAVAAGAIEITQRQAAIMNRRRRLTGAMGAPDEALAWFRAQDPGTKNVSHNAHSEANVHDTTHLASKGGHGQDQ